MFYLILLCYKKKFLLVINERNKINIYFVYFYKEKIP